jgi:acyl-coenzyme A synthetase/AMP-(fatty) acid ligase
VIVSSWSSTTSRSSSLASSVAFVRAWCRSPCRPWPHPPTSPPSPPTRRPASSSCRRSTPTGFLSQRERPRCVTPSCGELDGEAASSIIPIRWSDLDDVREAAVAATTTDSQAFWLYSSGTTGIPKGVIHRQADQQATYDTYAAQVLRVTPDDRCLSVAKLFFAYGLGNSLTFPLAAGGTAILEPRPPTPRDIVDLVSSDQPTLFFASPGFVAALLDADLPENTFASVRCTVTAGEALPTELQSGSRQIHPRSRRIGSTEALHIFVSNTLDDQRPGTSGRVVAGYDAVLRRGRPRDHRRRDVRIPLRARTIDRVRVLAA